MFHSLPLALLQQHSLWELVLAASPVAKFVLVLLLLASLMSWAVIFAKWSQFRHSGAANAAFLRAFRMLASRSRGEGAAATISRFVPISRTGTI